MGMPTMYWGDDATFTSVISQFRGGPPFNLTGCSLQLKLQHGASQIEKDTGANGVVITNAVLGTVATTFVPTDTNKFPNVRTIWDAQWELTDSNGKVTMVEAWNLQVLPKLP